MCGIVGALSFRSSAFTITERLLTAMRDTMEHRGPDGAGNWISPERHLVLGHSRLSIIDLSESAAQPMSNGDADFGSCSTRRYTTTRRYYCSERGTDRIKQQSCR
jgi:asparagine synthase (glutamine-hydrolysing)